MAAALGGGASSDESLLFVKPASLQLGKEWVPGELRLLSRTVAWRPDVESACGPQSVPLIEVTGERR
jgi:hypothetical protein